MHFSQTRISIKFDVRILESPETTVICGIADRDYLRIKHQISFVELQILPRPAVCTLRTVGSENHYLWGVFSKSFVEKLSHSLDSSFLL